AKAGQEGRHGHMDSVIHFIGCIFPVPGVELYDGGRAADRTAFGGYPGQEDPVGFEGVDDLRVGVIRYDGADVRVDIAQLFEVVGAPNAAADLFQTQVGDGEDKTGIDLFAFCVDYFCIAGGREDCAYAGDLTVIDFDGAPFDDLAVADVNGAAGDKELACIRLCGIDIVLRAR